MELPTWSHTRSHNLEVVWRYFLACEVGNLPMYKNLRPKVKLWCGTPYGMVKSFKSMFYPWKTRATWSIAKAVNQIKEFVTKPTMAVANFTVQSKTWQFLHSRRKWVQVYLSKPLVIMNHDEMHHHGFDYFRWSFSSCYRQIVHSRTNRTSWGLLCELSKWNARLWNSESRPN